MQLLPVPPVRSPSSLRFASYCCYDAVLLHIPACDTFFCSRRHNRERTLSRLLFAIHHSTNAFTAVYLNHSLRLTAFAIYDTCGDSPEPSSYRHAHVRIRCSTNVTAYNRRAADHLQPVTDVPDACGNIPNYLLFYRICRHVPSCRGAFAGSPITYDNMMTPL